MERSIRACRTTVILLPLICGCLFAQNNNSAWHRTWKVTIIKASHLINLDWGKRKVSDPFVEVREYLSGVKIGEGRAFEKVSFLFYDKHERRYDPKLKDEPKVSWATLVKQDDLSPNWNQAFTARRGRQDGRFKQLVFFVLDKDPLGHQFLGAASLDKPAPGTYTLRLCRLFSTKTLMPGTLTVKIEQETPEVQVPNVARLSIEQARQKLYQQYLVPRISYRYVDRQPRPGIISQSPQAGKKAPMDTSVTCVMERGRTFTVPNVVGLPPHQARQKLHLFRVILATDVKAAMQTKNCYKVLNQSIKPGQKTYRTTPITITICQPGPGTKVKVPDVVGLSIPQARHKLAGQYLRRITLTRKETKLKTAGRVLEQKPKAGEEVAFDQGECVKLVYGWYADGCTFNTAKTVEFDKPFACSFATGGSQFRKVQVDRPGYLVVEAAQSVPPWMFLYCRISEATNRQIARGYLPRSARVEAGEWVFELSVKLAQGGFYKTPRKFRTRFVPEFDGAEPNNSFDTATVIPPRDTLLTIGHCQNKDEDVYRITLPEAGYLLVNRAETEESKPHAEKRPVSFKLYNGKTERIARGQLTQLHWLAKGDYYLNFIGPDSFSFKPYRISVKFLQDGDRTEPNEKPEQATPLPVSQPIQVRYESEGQDFYRLEVPEPGYVILSHPRKLGHWTYLYRIGPKGDKLEKQELPCAIYVEKEQVVALRTEEQNRPLSSFEPVLLNTSFIPLTDDKYEPNNTPAQAKPVPTNENFKALMIPARDVDCYRFTVKKRGNVSFGLSAQSPRLHLEGTLYDTTGKAISKRFNLPTTLDLKPGIYNLQINQWGGIKTFSSEHYQFYINTPGAKKQEGKEGGKDS